MKIKLTLSTVVACIAAAFLQAQSNIGIDSYLLGDDARAEDFFKNHIAENAEVYNYYLGEIAFAKGDTEKAASYYNEGLRANAQSALNKIGLAGMKLKTDPQQAENALNEVIKDNKKDIGILLAVGRTYLHNGMTQQAMQQVDAARKMDDKNPNVYVLEGDIIASGNTAEDIGKAAGKYEMATYFSPNYTLGYMKYARIYERVNPTQSIEKLKTVIAKQPNYMSAYGLLGRLYTQNGFYKDAIAIYQTFFKSELYTVDDIEKYARANYFTDNYTEAERLVDEGLKKDPAHFVLNRYKMYLADKAKKTDEAAAVANTFFALRDTAGYITEDYTVYASILSRSGRFDDACLQYDKAIRIDPKEMKLYTEAASMARQNKNYAVAASYVQRQMDEKATLSGDVGYQDDVVDINTLGYDYYSAGVSIAADKESVDSLMSLYYLHKADSVFDILISRVPDSYSGYRYKALTQHAIDPKIEDGAAEPYYEKVIDVITKNHSEPSDSEKNVLLEAYNYLGYYYYMKSDAVNTKQYWQKVLDIDPDNKNAKLVLDDMKE